MTDKQPEALEKIAKALLVVAQLCDGTKRWTMSVPARPDSDPDLVLSDALREADTLLRTQHAEIERLNSCLKWEQNRADRIGTHQPGCETWGPRHYECALRAIERKDALLSRCLDAFETDDWMKKLTAAGEIRKELSQ